MHRVPLATSDVAASAFNSSAVTVSVAFVVATIAFVSIISAPAVCFCASSDFFTLAVADSASAAPLACGVDVSAGSGSFSFRFAVPGACGRRAACGRPGLVATLWSPCRLALCSSAFHASCSFTASSSSGDSAVLVLDLAIFSRSFAHSWPTSSTTSSTYFLVPWWIPI